MSISQKFFCALLLLALSISPAAALTDKKIDISKLRGPKISELSMLIISNPDAQIMAA